MRQAAVGKFMAKPGAGALVEIWKADNEKLDAPDAIKLREKKSPKKKKGASEDRSTFVVC